MKQMVFSPGLKGVLALAIIAMAGAGCGTGAAPRDLMMEEANSGPVERPVAMQGESTFLEGKLESLVTVSRGLDRRHLAGAKGGRGGKGGERRGRKDDNMFGQSNTFYGDSDEDQKAAMEEYVRMAKAQRAAGSPMPPVTIHVSFDNKGTEPVEIEVTEVNSDLGNFAPRPTKVTVAPGQTGTLDPMISQLGVTSDEIPLKLGVRVGDKSETKVVVVKNVISAAAQQQFEKMK